MLKRINVKQLVVGMYLKEFCGSWMNHPFWRNEFLITDPKDITTILASPIAEVVIDTAKGLDVPTAPEAQSQTVVEAPVANPVEVSTPAAAPQVRLESVAAQQEFARAAKICSQAKQATMAMFQEARMGRALDTAEAQEVVHAISDSVTRNASALISLARLKTADDYTYMHSVAVCAMMVALARQLKLDEAQIRAAGMAGLMHDLGKALMPMSVLNKPGKLTDAEFAIIRSHPAEGHKMMLAAGGIDASTRDVCLHHHEKMDGTGYPEKLKGDDISLFAKMGAVCDVYDAITSNRPYKAGWDPAESLRQMAEWANGHFDPKVFQAFVRSLGIYPIGSLVRLTSGRIGVVVDQGSKSLTQPQVKVFFSTRANLRIPPEVIDLSNTVGREQIESREDPAKWRFPDLNELWSGLDKKPW